MNNQQKHNPPEEQELEKAILRIQQAGLKLAVREDLLQAVIDLSPFPISLLTCPDLCYVLANPAKKSTLKNPAGFHLGRTVDEMDASESNRKRERMLKQIQETGQPLHMREVHASVGPEEREAWWNLDMLPLFDDCGRVEYILILEQEITDLVNDRQLLERSNRDLQEFAFIASHDLKEPLRKISAFGEILLSQAENFDKQQRDYLVRLCSSAARMQNMVEELLKLSRLTTHPRTFVRIDLGQIISEVVSDLVVQIQQSSATVDVGPLPVIVGDRLLIGQLFQNLIGNALKFHKPDLPPDIKIYFETLTGDAVRIFIADNGIGFSMEDAERIFQPFQRLESRSLFEGSGMGLAICRKIVDRHGGTITAISKPGEGATFVVTLPLGYMGGLRGSQL